MIKEYLQPPFKSPGFPPFDSFWRQAGEYWLVYEWLPYWESLTEQEKENYLIHWQVPEEWRVFSCYINTKFNEWLEFIDND